MSRAVVLGGSVAGLFAARVLADRFDEVTVVERDRLSDDPGLRKGVPQGRHVHSIWGPARSAGEDLRYPEVAGVRPPGTALINAYVARLHRASHRHEDVRRAMVRVFSFDRPLTEILSPRIAWRALTG